MKNSYRESSVKKIIWITIFLILVFVFGNFIRVQKIINDRQQKKESVNERVNQKYEFVSKQEIPVSSSINTILIDVESAKIQIRTTGGENIKITDKSVEKINDNKKLKITQNGEKLNLNKENGHGYDIYKPDIVEICIPKTYANNLNIKNDSGTVEIVDKLKLEDMKIISDKGNLKATDNLNLNTLTCDTSKNVNLKDVNAKEINIKSETSEIVVNKASGNLNIKSNLGKIKINEIAGKGMIQSENGNVDCNIAKVEGRFDFITSKGEIILKLNNDEKVNIDAESKKSEVKNNIKNSKDAPEENLIFVRNEVGNIKIDGY